MEPLSGWIIIKGLEIYIDKRAYITIFFSGVRGPYKVVQKRILAAKPTILKNTTAASQMPQKWVQWDQRYFFCCDGDDF